ncbi:MAG: tRNA (guanosine(37)-N1)-methyltransferase TrmD [Candidatus Promineifilaceae bacterium]|nr:tRNA (guanosine(37)-N1)-methyltransferase TrmD [Candidatus Promineifilaceae bacterium]
MRFDILTLFPEMFPGYLNHSILKRAQEAGILQVVLHRIRDFAKGKHRITDEPPYGGGGGMILKPEPLFAAVESLLEKPVDKQEPVILLTPQGRTFTQQVAQELVQYERLILVCGRYEGVDERVRSHLVTDEISIGDYVLTGGELGAMVIVDAITRLIPGVLGSEAAADSDSYATGLLEGPHYTRPESFRGWFVPDVLRSGHAANIRQWRREQALIRTWQRRPDLLRSAVLSDEDRQFIAVLEQDIESSEDPSE